MYGFNNDIHKFLFVEPNQFPVLVSHPSPIVKIEMLKTTPSTKDFLAITGTTVEIWDARTASRGSGPKKTIARFKELVCKWTVSTPSFYASGQQQTNIPGVAGVYLGIVGIGSYFPKGWQIVGWRRAGQNGSNF